MRTLLAAACLIAVVGPAGADDDGSKLMSCRGAYRAMAALAEQGKYATSAAENAAAKARFATAADNAEELARNAYVVAKKTGAIETDLAKAEKDLDGAFSDGSGKVDQSKIDEWTKECDKRLEPQ